RTGGGDRETGEYGVASFFPLHVLPLFSHHHHQFAFIMPVRRVARDNDGDFRMLERRDRLVEDLRMSGPRPASEVASVIQADGEDLAWLAGVQQRRFRKLADHSGWGALAEKSAADFVDVIAIQNAVRDAGGGK